ncbi:MAG: LLM class flavin-dependent oxidoreductase [Candidatus Promineifilaceae bacterium]|jgi:probable F420-dependent oxidoreductase
MKIGLVINHAEVGETAVTPSYSQIRDIAQLAEAGDLDSIWLFDHLLFRSDEETSGIWECWTMLCALAEATTRVELGTIVLCNPFRNPALLAKMAHTLDEISAGRLILGIGAGWYEPEFKAFGFPYDHRVGRFEEALQILKPLLNSQSVTFNGDYYQVQDCAIVPTGPRPSIPLLIGSGGPRMLRLTARYANQWNTAWLGDASDLPRRISRISDACAAEGRDPASLGITVGIDVIFPDLGPTEQFTKDPLSGTAEEITKAFRDYEKAGADHLIAHLTPQTETAVRRLSEAAEIYKS